MNEQLFDKIVERASQTGGKIGQLQLAIVCVNFANEVVNPDDFGPEIADEFKKRAESVALAISDRKALLEWINRSFEVEWTRDGDAA